MGLLTLLVAGVHACVSLVNFRAGFLLFIFLYASYPRLFALGLGQEGFALTAQRMMIMVTVSLLMLRFLYGATDLKRGFAMLRKESGLAFLFSGLLLSKVIGNLVTGRLDFPAIVSFVDEAVVVFFLLMMTFTVIRTARDVYLVLLAITLSLLPNQFAAIIEFITQESIFPSSLQLDFETNRSAEGMVTGGVRFGSYRVMGTFESSLKLMEMSVLALPMAAYLWTTATARYERYVLGFITLMGPLVIYWTGSRTGQAMLALQLTVYAFQYVRWKFGRMESLLVIVLSALFFSVFLGVNARSIIQGWLFAAGAEKSSLSRVFQYLLSWPLFLQSPWFGYGFARNIVDVIDLDRMDGYYLRTVMEGGLVSLFCLIALFVRSIRRLRMVGRRSSDPAAKPLTNALVLTLAGMLVMMLALNMGTSAFYAFLLFALVPVIQANYAPEVTMAEYKVGSGEVAAEPAGNLSK